MNRIEGFKGWLSSFKFTALLLLVYSVVLAIATFVEKYDGAAFAKQLIYHSPLTLFLWGMMTLNFVLLACRKQYMRMKKMAMLMVHFAFVIIMLGAVVTHLFGKEGILHIREGESSNILMKYRNGEMKTEFLPFSVTLNDFILQRYPGSDSPSSYESMVTVNKGASSFDACIYMNHVLDVGGYRLYQTSFDEDEKGSVLTVSYDFLGRIITYLGYMMLAVGFILSFLSPAGRFMELFRQLMRLNKMNVFLLFVFMVCQPLCAGNHSDTSVARPHIIDKEHARVFGGLPIQSISGRMMPINTYSSEVLRKIHKSMTFEGLDSDQFLVSLLVVPEYWMDVPLFKIDNVELASRYALPFPYCSYSDFFDADESYRLDKDLEVVYRKNPSERNALEKGLVKLDENVNIFHLLIQDKQLNIFPLPDDVDRKWYSPGDDLSEFSGNDSIFVSQIFVGYKAEVLKAARENNWETANKIVGMIHTFQQSKCTGVDISARKLKAEVLYNKLDIFKCSRVGYLLLGGILFLLSVGNMMCFFKTNYCIRLLVPVIGAFFLYHTFGILLRWYISGYAPWSNSYETMVCVAWTMLLAGLLFLGRSVIVFSLSVLFSGVLLFVTGLNWMDPQITSLVPVLKSPWLMFHVAVIVAAYGFWGLSSLIGLLNLFLMFARKRTAASITIGRRIREFTLINEMSLWIGLALMTIGTFLGAVWANESWGRYWGWDPKETWALITVLVYTLVTHIHLLKIREAVKEWLLNFLSVISLSFVVMTFWGVNYFLTGMHSYGSMGNASAGFIWVCVVFLFVIIVGFSSYYFVVRLQYERKMGSEE